MAAKPRKEIDTSTYSGRLAVRLRNLREKVGLTVPAFAEAVTKAGFKVTAATIYSWEGANSSPHVDAFPYVAKALQLKSVRDLIPRA